MSDADGDHDRKSSKVVFSTLVANGDWLYMKGEYKKAIENYASALTLKPGDRTCLVGRSKSYLKTGQSENALRDAEASLEEDATYFEGLYRKAEALYHMGEFEFALVFYHRGQKLRPQVQEFRLGIQKAQEAIESSVGSPSSVKLKIKGDLSFLQKEEERVQPITAIQRLTKEKDEQPQKTPKRKMTTKQMLGEFYSDKKYLENLLKDEDLVKGKMKGGEQLQDVIHGCLSYLDACTELRSQEKPVRARKHGRKLTQRKRSKGRRNAPCGPGPFLLRSLDDIDAELTSGNAEESLKKAEDVMKMVQEWSEEEVPNKNEVLGSLHSCMGNALIDLGDMDQALHHHQKDLELAQQSKDPDEMSRALDNIGRVYAQIGQFSQAIESWEKKIPLIRGGLEKTWLFHEIGRCCLELGRPEQARGYGVRSAAAADAIGDEKWQINANVLVAQAEMKLGNVESCVSHFEKALSCSKLQEDEDAMKAIQKALDEAKQK
ncbi:outer dynein arm-docking complex subunit 4 [Brachionichthys hirsutus]|uniref:outer dynein arm-docking complex subunit 4 n=1 Tax=Brachionichthys hirsutus TaxID=412623 RepID=UPI00360522C2